MKQHTKVLEIGWLLPRIGIAGDICFRRPTPIQGRRDMMTISLQTGFVN